jgi:hypothetical protein
LLLHDERKESEHSSLSAVVRSEDEDQIFDADDEYESPDDERQDSVDVCRIGGEPVFGLEALAEGVERTGPDVAVDDAERNECQLSESLPGGMRLGVFRDLLVLLGALLQVQNQR